MIGQYYLERHYARGSVRQLPPDPAAADTAGPAHPARTAAGYGRFPGDVEGRDARRQGQR